MWSYDKRLQFPVKIKNPDPQLAKIVISQLGGPDGELGASMRYLNQRYAMPYKECKGILTDIGTEELAHMEMISSILYQLTRNLTPEQGRLRCLLCRSYNRYLSSVCRRYPVVGRNLPVQGRPHHRFVRRYGRRSYTFVRTIF